MLRRVLLAAALALISWAMRPENAPAQSSAWQQTPQAEIRLVAAPGDSPASLWLGLDFRLQPGWKIYWRTPGDAGLPPTIAWHGNINISIGDWEWPAPQRFALAGLHSFGYEGEIVLPIAARRADPKSPARLVAAVDFLTCKTLCVPGHVDLMLDVPAGAIAPEWAALIGGFRASVPRAGGGGLQILDAVAGTEGKIAHLDIVLAGAPPPIAPDALIENDQTNIFTPPVFITDAEGRTILRLTAPDSDADKSLLGLVGKKITITAIDRAAPVDKPRATVATLTVESGSAWPAPARSHALIPLLALLGGFILNFMPCVLPVLSIKLLSLVERGRGEVRALRLGMLASAAGILTAFLALALSFAGIKAAGLAVGWGVQFQNPVFLTILLILVTAFAGNLAGLYEIALPGFVADRMGQFSPGHQRSPTVLGNFLLGIFATVLATPCSAPFLGTAVGFALAGGTFDIIAIFLCLGIGFALPYLAVAAVPAMARLLPRPGYWMIHLRRFLGLLLLLTALWLALILAGEVRAIEAMLVLSLALAGTALLGVGHLGQRPIAGRVAPLAFLAALLLAGTMPQTPDDTDRSASGLWHRYDPAEVTRAVGVGRVVYVHVTARWCLTCQANQRLVLDREPVLSHLDVPGIEALRGDWTRPDPAIEALLRRFGRYGIPFDVIYGPGAPQGLPLSEILTPRAVLDALDRAASPAR